MRLSCMEKRCTMGDMADDVFDGMMVREANEDYYSH
jgi:hypothetical protein